MTERRFDEEPAAPTPELEQHQFAYLTTSGRATGRPHRIEIWFVIIDGHMYVNSGGGRNSDWVKNLIVNSTVEVEVGEQRWIATSDLLDASADHPARRALAARYQGWSPGQPLSAWATDSLLIQIELELR